MNKHFFNFPTFQLSNFVLSIPPEQIQTHNQPDKRHEAELYLEPELKFQCAEVDEQGFVVDEIPHADRNAVGKERLDHRGPAGQHKDNAVEVRTDDDAEQNGDDERGNRAIFQKSGHTVFLSIRPLGSSRLLNKIISAVLFSDK